jgi:copper transport protein
MSPREAGGDGMVPENEDGEQRMSNRKAGLAVPGVWIGSVGLMLMLATAGVYAHTRLLESQPAADAVLAQAPEQITLSFSEPVRLTALSVRSAGSAAQQLTAAESGASERFTATLPALEPGEHTVSWRVISADTHVVSGEVRFTVRPAAAGAHGH